jgi:hypothetical protein
LGRVNDAHPFKADGGWKLRFDTRIVPSQVKQVWRIDRAGQDTNLCFTAPSLWDWPLDQGESPVRR